MVAMSLIDFSQQNEKAIYDLFKSSLILKRNFNNYSLSQVQVKGIAYLLFFEPSTRTRFSFESACARSGVHPIVLSSATGTSLEKGETMEDTVFNLDALRPLFFVIRCPDELDLLSLAKEIKTPIFNAGWGWRGHPTQALLDALTLYERWETLRGKKLLFVGDIKHSRVVSSHLDLAKICGYKIGYSAPHYFLPVETEGIEVFSNVNEGLKWADAVCALRVQKERHFDENVRKGFDVDLYKMDFGINQKSLTNLKSDGVILHPGPINYGIEIEKEILKDPRSVILKLVENGMFIRQAIVQNFLNGKT